jgi:hypothetical protein
MTTLPAQATLTSTRNFWLGVAAYLVPSFPIGLVSMLIQGVIFSLAYPRFFPGRGGAVLRPGLLYGAGLAVLSWSFTTLAVAAKNIMGSVPTYLVLETGFTMLQFVVVGPLIALAYRR